MYFFKKYYPELFFLISTEEIRGSGLSAPVNIHSDLRIFNALIQAPSDIRITYLREQALERPDPVCDRTIDPVVSIRIIPAMKDSVVKELREAFRASLRTCCGLFREIVSRKPKEFFITAPGK